MPWREVPHSISQIPCQVIPVQNEVYDRSVWICLPIIRLHGPNFDNRRRFAMAGKPCSISLRIDRDRKYILVQADLHTVNRCQLKQIEELKVIARHWDVRSRIRNRSLLSTIRAQKIGDLLGIYEKAAAARPLNPSTRIWRGRYRSTYDVRAGGKPDGADFR